MNNIICTIDIKVHCYSTINEMHREVTSSCCTAGIVLEPLSRAADSRIITLMHHKLCYNLQVKIVPLCFFCIPQQTEEGRTREYLTNIKHVPTTHFQDTVDYLHVSLPLAPWLSCYSSEPQFLLLSESTFMIKKR